jgi:HlyD family secretion protein
MATATGYLYREAAQKNRYTADRLTDLLEITPARSWLALLAVVLILSAVAFWAVTGRVPTRVDGQAVITRVGGVQSVLAPSTGQVLALHVKVGDHVRPQQLIARIAQPVLAERYRSAKDALEQARRERLRAMDVKMQSSQLEIASIHRQKEATNREIVDLEGRVKLTEEEIRVEETLFSQGLHTKQQVIQAKQKKADVETQIQRLRSNLVQLDAQLYSVSASPAQVQADNDAKVADLERRLSELEREMGLAEKIVSPYAGEVLELKTYAGATVGLGAPILSLQPEGENLELLAYVPAGMAKEVRPGLPVEISPSSIKREEFGFMKGVVRFTASFPATQAALMRNFENDSLVQSLIAGGPVTELRIGLARDPSNPTGFQWSTKTGPPIQLSSGTLATVRIVTREQKPISLVIPYMKSWMEY